MEPIIDGKVSTRSDHEWLDWPGQVTEQNFFLGRRKKERPMLSPSVATRTDWVYGNCPADGTFVELGQPEQAAAPHTHWVKYWSKWNDQSVVLAEGALK